MAETSAQSCIDRMFAGKWPGVGAWTSLSQGLAWQGDSPYPGGLRPGMCQGTSPLRAWFEGLFWAGPWFCTTGPTAWVPVQAVPCRACRWRWALPGQGVLTALTARSAVCAVASLRCSSCATASTCLQRQVHWLKKCAQSSATSAQFLSGIFALCPRGILDLLVVPPPCSLISHLPALGSLNLLPAPCCWTLCAQDSATMWPLEVCV